MSSIRYTVMTIIIDHYEMVHEIAKGARSDRARYLLITDRPDLKSKTWEVVYDSSLSGSAFHKVMDIRWHAWRYTDDDIVVSIDGSVGINDNLDPIIDAFQSGQYDMSLLIHPHRQTASDELQTWVRVRGYSQADADRQQSIMETSGYDVQAYRGLYQMNYMIRRINAKVYSYMETVAGILRLAGHGEYDRLDQVLASFVLNMWFSDMKVLWVSGQMVSSRYMTWYCHGSSKPIRQGTMIEPYALDHPQRVMI